MQIGDMGYGPNSDGTVAALKNVVEHNGAHFLMHTGDSSYAGE